MKKILITGATDGIGLITSSKLVSQNHHLLIHGRNPNKLEDAKQQLLAVNPEAKIEPYLADLSNLDDVKKLAHAVLENHSTLDVLINNAGVYKTPNPVTADGFDLRIVVNTLSPYLLTRELMSLFDKDSRVVNLSSAAQASVDTNVLLGRSLPDDEFNAYAQSKLAITMWTRSMAQEKSNSGPIIIAVNPGSLLATKMVREGFGTPGNDINIGADILIRAALSEGFATANGEYYDNDNGRFANPHTDALNPNNCAEVVEAIDAALSNY